MSTSSPKLYVLPASPPCTAVQTALALKSIAFDRVDLLPLSQLVLGPPLYGGITVPAMRIGGERLVGSRPIMRRLDDLVPEPPLLPAPGEAAYARVLQAERWGDEVFQSATRRILTAAFLRRPAQMESYVGDAKLPLPRSLLRLALPATARLMALRYRAGGDGASADLAALGRQLDRVDGWIAEGLLGGERVNAADLQIGSSIRVLMSIGDVRPLIAERPAAGLTRYFPALAAGIGAGALPAEWARSPASAA